MILKIEIDCKNAAFNDADPQWEVGRILENLASDIINGRVEIGGKGHVCNLRDINGNTVGKVKCV